MPELTLNHDAELPVKVGRRTAARLRLSIPARLTTIYSNCRCILIDLSSTGAQVALEEPLRVGQMGYLHIAGLEIFALVVRSGGGVNGLAFEIPLSKRQVLEVRSFSERFQQQERSAMRAEVRSWVTGGR